jgi:hypothetical protein
VTSIQKPGALEWRELVIPDGEPAVLVHRLFSDPATGVLATLVRFPAGWRRPHSGHYLVEEEALFLDGSFEMSGLEYQAGTFAFFPAGYLRESSIAANGAMAVAWFGGRADWYRGPGPTDSLEAVRIPEWKQLPRAGPPPLPSVDGARLLRRHASGSTWILDRSPSGHAPENAAVELLSLADLSFVRLDAGASMPQMVAPLLCRLRAVSR